MAAAVLKTGRGRTLFDGGQGIVRRRPSPESDTRPVKLSRFGFLASAAAVRSNSHDAITLPRRHTSATSGRFRSY